MQRRPCGADLAVDPVPHLVHAVLGEGAALEQLVDAVDGEEALHAGAQALRHGHLHRVRRHHLLAEHVLKIREKSFGRRIQVASVEAIFLYLREDGLHSGEVVCPDRHLHAKGLADEVAHWPQLM